MQSALRFLVLMSVAAMCADISYEGARGIVGPYLGAVGASAATIGFFAGLGELLGYGLRVAAGWLADRTGAYFPLTLCGYLLTFGAIGGLGMASSSLGLALALVLCERIGKALRAPARSHLVAQAARAPGGIGEGKGFGLDEALDQIGAITGPLVCAFVVSRTARHGGALVDGYRAAFVVLALPGVANLLLLGRARRLMPQVPDEPPSPPGTATAMGWPLRLYLLALALLSAGFVDWALVGLHIDRSRGGQAVGWLGSAAVPLLYAGAMAVDGIAALGLGVLFDRWRGRRGVLTLALGALAAAAAPALLFLDWDGLGPTVAQAMGIGGVVLWGVGMGAQESVCKAAIARFVPSPQRGRAYGLFYGLFGLSWWAGSALFGALYDHRRTLLVAVSAAAQLAAALLLVVVASTDGAAAPSPGSGGAP